VTVDEAATDKVTGNRIDSPPEVPSTTEPDPTEMVPTPVVDACADGAANDNTSMAVEHTLASLARRVAVIRSS
jgi:hypothetical protein